MITDVQPMWAREYRALVQTKLHSLTDGQWHHSFAFGGGTPPGRATAGAATAARR